MCHSLPIFIHQSADAIRARDGIDFAGGRIRVEMSRPREERFRGPPPGRDGGFRDGGMRDGRGPPPRRNSELTIRVMGLPDRTSWQDLKDFARSAGDVNFAKIIGVDVGVVDYYNKEDFERALETLDGKELTNRYGDASKVRCEPDAPRGPPGPPGGPGPMGRSRSPPRDGPGGYGRGRSRSPPRDGPGGYGRGRSRSPPRDGPGGYGRSPPRDGPGGYGRSPPRDGPQVNGDQPAVNDHVDAPPAAAAAAAAAGGDAVTGDAPPTVQE